jgi:hypothetical protein
LGSICKGDTKGRSRLYNWEAKDLGWERAYYRYPNGEQLALVVVNAKPRGCTKNRETSQEVLNVSGIQRAQQDDGVVSVLASGTPDARLDFQTNILVQQPVLKGLHEEEEE